MKVRILKGTEQIGGCIAEISTDKTKIIIDYGENLDGKKQIDIPALTDDNCEDKYDAVFITHSHGDHIGNIGKIRKDINIYVEEKNAVINDVLCDFQKKYDSKIRANKNANIKFFEFEKAIEIGDIKITPYIVDHSSYNSSMFLIEGNGKKILHTGDYRNHGRKGKIFKSVLNKIGPVDLLITEGTTLTRKNDKPFKKEVKLMEDLKDVIDKYDQVYFMCSSTNIDRIVSLYKSSINTHMFIEDLCMNSVTKEIPNIPNSNTFSNVYTYMTEKYRGIKEPYERYRKYTKKVIEEIPFDKKFVMSVKTSMKPELEKNKNKIKKACLIYSMWDGYISEDYKEPSTREFVEFLEALNIDFYDIHTSGHADGKAMKQVIDILKPKQTIMIHTESKDIDKAREIFGNSVIEINDNEYIEVN